MADCKPLIETLCEFVWNGFTQVDFADERNYILDLLELAEIAGDNNDRRTGLQWLHSAFYRVFGCSSDELRDFESHFNEGEVIGANMWSAPPF